MILSAVVTFLGLVFSFLTGSVLAWVGFQYRMRRLMHSLNRDAPADIHPTTNSFALRQEGAPS
jgi:hypothetical protein